MTKPIIVVSGATGAQGGSVLEHLYKTGRFDLVALTRSVTSDKSKALAARFPGIRLAQAELTNKNELLAALKGAAGFFIVTQFWEKLSEEDDFLQGKTAIEAAKESNVGFTVFSALPGSTKSANLHVPHFDSKWRAVELLRASGIKYALVFAAFYQENWDGFGMKRLAEDGKTAVFTAPMAGKRWGAFSVKDTGVVVTELFTHPSKYHNKVVDIFAQQHSLKDVVEEYTKATGKPATAYEPTVEEYGKFGFPGAQELSDMFKYFQWIHDSRISNKMGNPFSSLGIKDEDYIAGGSQFGKLTPWSEFAGKSSSSSHHSDEKKGDGSKIVVVGSSGYVGSAVLNTLAAGGYTKKHNVVAVIRDPKSDKAKGLVSLSGVTAVAGDMSSPASLEPAFSGADVALIVTPGVGVSKENRTKVTVDAVAVAHKVGVKSVVVISVHTADVKDTIFGKQFGDIEEQVKKIGIPYTLVRLPMFIENIWGQAGSIKGHGAFYSSVNSSAKHSEVALADAGEAISVILSNPGLHLGKTYHLNSPVFSYDDLAAAFSKKLNKEVKHVQVPEQGVIDSLKGFGMEEWQCVGIVELHRLINKGDSSVVNTQGAKDFEAITGHAPLTIEQWVEKNGAGFA